MDKREYLTFTRKEKSGVLTLLVVLMALVLFAQYKGSDEPEMRVSAAEFAERLPPQKTQRRRDTIIKYVRMKEYVDRGGSYGRRQKSGYVGPLGRPRRMNDTIDINRSDTAEFIALPGIGSVLAKRIIAFRTKLGGFYSVQQIKEVYGITDSVFRLFSARLRCDSSLVQRVDINRADTEILRQHPYIRWKIANAVIAYRVQHGAFDSVAELSKINVIDSATLTKMIPYLSANN